MKALREAPAWRSRSNPEHVTLTLPRPERHRSEHAVDAAPKTQKATRYPDAPVVRYVRGMGTGYQARINRLLSWLKMKLADKLKIMEVIEGRLGIDEYLERGSGEGVSSEN